MHDDDTTRYERYVLTEALRLHELRNGAFDDSAAVTFARKTRPDFETRLVARALHLVREHGLITSKSYAGRPSFNPTIFIYVFGALLGVFIGRTALAGPGLVNALVVVGGLLSVQALGLVMWFSSFYLPLDGRQTLFPLIKDAVEHVFKHKGFALLQLQARTILDQRSSLSRWRIGILVHGGWVAIYLAVLLTFLSILSLKRFDFVVESTILDDSYFAFVVRVLGALPNQIGFPVPSDADIRNALDGVPGDHLARRAWAWWIIGVSSIWALLPRVVLWLLCYVVVRRREKLVSLNLEDPYYARLRGVLLPQQPPEEVNQPPAPSASSADEPNAEMTGPPIIIGLEVTEQPWSNLLPSPVLNGGLVNDSAERTRVRNLLARECPNRLMVACNADISPDRGSLKVIAEFAKHSGRVGIWLVRSRDDGDDVRLNLWRDELLSRGYGEDSVFSSQEDAFRWLLRP